MAAFFSYGFRPFFLGAALFAAVAIPVWILMLIQAGDSALFHTGRRWHAHEMIFGFLPAVITGFLLTASWVTPVVAHVVLHASLIVHGSEMPPHDRPADDASTTPTELRRAA